MLIVPPQLQSSSVDLDNEMTRAVASFRALVDCVAKLEKLPKIEIISHQVHGGRHFIREMDETGDFVGISRQLLRFVSLEAIETDDQELLLVVFPDLEKNKRKIILKNLTKLNPRLFLNLIGLSLQIFPKSAESWHFRRHLLRIQNNQTRQMTLSICLDEFELILAAAASHKCNYYAWEHARYCIKETNQLPAVILEAVVDFARKNVTDSSVFSFLLFCANFHRNLAEKIYFSLGDELVELYPQNRIIWSFRYTLLRMNQTVSMKSELDLFRRLFDSNNDLVFGKYHEKRIICFQTTQSTTPV
jgi:hypothetical protein